jgi:hypothetical protein
MKKVACLLWLVVLVPCLGAQPADEFQGKKKPSQEIDGEVGAAYINPYHSVLPGFAVSFRPPFLRWKSFSLGAGMGINISSRFQYEGPTEDVPIPPEPEGDSTKHAQGWVYFDENFVELVNFNFFAEVRWQFLTQPEKKAWQGWLTLSGGEVVNSSVKTRYQTQYLPPDTSGVIEEYEKFTDRFAAKYRSEPYLAPGIMLGKGNFIFGYQHFVYFDAVDLIKGRPLRLGYKFTW